jgi:hypothetical protein
MSVKKILIGVPNEGELSFNLEDVKSWKPTDISKLGEVVYFKHDDTYYSMKTLVFNEIFGV